MSLVPAFELGVWNCWILMAWILVMPVLSNFITRDKKVSKKLRTSVPIRFEKTLNVLSMAVVIFGFIYSIFLPMKIGTIWFYVGGIIFLLGFILYFWILLNIRNSTIDKPFTKGPYRFSRHPIYISTFLILLSVTIISLSWVFLILLIVVLVHLLLSVPAEEKYCLERYGKVYGEYLRKTPRWIGIPKK